MSISCTNLGWRPQFSIFDQKRICHHRGFQSELRTNFPYIGKLRPHSVVSPCGSQYCVTKSTTFTPPKNHNSTTPSNKKNVLLRFNYFSGSGKLFKTFWQRCFPTEPSRATCELILWRIWNMGPLALQCTSFRPGIRNIALERQHFWPKRHKCY